MDPTNGVTTNRIELTREKPLGGEILGDPSSLESLGAAVVETIVEKMLGEGNEKAVIRLSNLRSILGADLTIEIRLPQLEAALAAYKKARESTDG